MRVSDLRLLTLAAFFVPSSLAACASIAGDFTTHPEDAGMSEDSSVDASGDGPVEAQGMDSSIGTDGPSTTDTGTAADTGSGMDSATRADASDAAACGNTICGTSCVDTNFDPSNCGACGNDCSMLLHVATATGITCSAGKCVIPPSSCETGYAHCTSNSQDGCETSLASSQSCGTCTTVCSGNTAFCGLSGAADAGGTYGCVSSCSGATPNLCGATCTNIETDPLNRNLCGHACPTVTGGGNATCTNGACGVSCNSGEHECGTTPKCAADTDINNCGPSCVACTAPTNGSVTCTSNVCKQSCPGTDTICSGACVDTTSNAMHCSSCTNACPAAQICVASACTCPTATPTFCSGTSTCVDTTSDQNNCGSCGHSCQGGTCAGGYCQAYVLASTAGTPGQIATDGTSVAWTQTGLGSAKGGVYSVNNTVANQTPTVIDSNATITYAAPIGMATGNIYYLATQGGSGYEGFGTAGVAGSGGNLATLGPNIVGYGVGVSPSGTNVVFGAYNATSTTVYVLSCTVPTGPCHLVFSQVDPNGLNGVVTDGTNAYYTQAGGLKWAPLTGATPASFISGLGSPLDIAIPKTGGFIYFTDNNTEYFWRSTIPTAAPKMLLDNSASGSPCYGMAADAKYYYFTDDLGVIYAPVGGGTVAHGGLWGGTSPTAVAIDSKSLYFIDKGAATINKIALPP